MEKKKGPVILATASYDHEIKLWQAHTGVCEKAFRHKGAQVNALDLTPDEQYVASGGYERIHLYDIAASNNTPALTCDSKNTNVIAIGFQEDGKWMYTGAEDGTVKLWDLRCPQMAVLKHLTMDPTINTVCLHPNQAEIYLGDQSGNIYIWCLDANVAVKGTSINERAANIQNLMIDPLGDYLGAVNNKGNLYLYDISKGSNEPELLKCIKAHSAYALKVRFSPDSSLVLTTSADKTAKIWSIADFSLIKELTDPEQRWVWDAAFSADSEFVITGSSDGTARLWDISTGNVKREYSGHSRAISALVFKDRPLF